MEEKENIKIRLSTLFLIFALIVIVIMGYCVYKLYKDKEAAKSNLAELNSQISELDSTINNLQGTINNISDIINNSNENTEIKPSSNEKTNENLSKIFSEAEIKNSIQNYLDLIGTRDGTPEQVIVDLGLMSRTGVYTDRTNDNFIRTDIKYSEFKNKILDYMTYEWFEDKFNIVYNKTAFKNIDEYLYFYDGGASGMDFEVKSVTLKGDYSDSVYIANVEFQEGEIGVSEWPVVDVEFHISNYNGKCVISYCDY